MGQPGSVIHHKITQLGRRQMEFDCFALAEPIGHPVYNLPPLIRSAMLILPTKPGQAQGDAPTLKVGSSCRVCPRAQCPARREPSIVGVSAEQL
jgi:hypothetical protein